MSQEPHIPHLPVGPSLILWTSGAANSKGSVQVGWIALAAISASYHARWGHQRGTAQDPILTQIGSLRLPIWRVAAIVVVVPICHPFPHNAWHLQRAVWEGSGLVMTGVVVKRRYGVVLAAEVGLGTIRFTVAPRVGMSSAATAPWAACVTLFGVSSVCDRSVGGPHLHPASGRRGEWGGLLPPSYGPAPAGHCRLVLPSISLAMAGLIA